MDKEIDKLEDLIIEKLHPFFSTVTKKADDGKVIYTEITLRFRKQEEIDALIRTLKSI